MPVNTEHPDYGKHIKQWDKCLHFYGGEDEVKSQGEMYLPCLKDGEDEYPNYKARAHFFDAFARTVQGLRGTMNRKPHIWEPELNDLPMPPIPEIDNHLLMYGRVGVLVDFDNQNRVPYYAIYRPHDIINWNTTGVGENERPNLIVLREMAHVMGYRTDDEFGYGVREVYRVLRLDEAGMFFSQTYEKLQNAPGYAVTEPIYPDGVQGRLNYIPFVCMNARTLGFTVEPPPLIGLVNLMWHYYLSSADLQAGRHKCGLPILWTRGFPDSTIMLGSTVAYNSTDPNAQVFYTELGGNALVNLERDLEECKTEAAILGSRMLEGTRPGIETAETTRIRQSGETATLMDVVTTAEQGINRLMEMAADRMRVGQIPQVQLNRDFVEIGLSPAEIATLITAWQQGAISFDTLFTNLKSGEIVPDERTMEEELDLIQMRPPQQERLAGVPGKQEEKENEDEDEKDEEDDEEDKTASMARPGAAQPPGARLRTVTK